MRRWLALVLLALLPLQFSWAAVAAYCGHEAGEAALHVGHHEHAHAGLPEASPDISAADPGAVADFDCGHCHGSGASLPAAQRDVDPAGLATARVTSAPGALRTRAPSPPERPQWRPLA